MSATIETVERRLDELHRKLRLAELLNVSELRINEISAKPLQSIGSQPELRVRGEMTFDDAFGATAQAFRDALDNGRVLHLRFRYSGAIFAASMRPLELHDLWFQTRPASRRLRVVFMATDLIDVTAMGGAP